MNLFKFALNFGKKKYVEDMEDPDNNNSIDSNDFESTEEIRDFCRKLPKEWAVVQLCKGHNKLTTTMEKDHILKTPSSIYLTLLAHCRSDEYPDPVCFRIPGSDELAGEFDVCFYISGLSSDSCWFFSWVSGPLLRVCGFIVCCITSDLECS